MGLASFMPRRAWVVVLALGTVAILSLLVPYDVVAGVIDVSFGVFFVAVSAVQLFTALGIGAVVYRHRTREEDRSEWKYD
jgi:hypothetical protein